MSKKTLYWICQFGGWGLLISSQIIFWYLQDDIDTNRLLNLVSVMIFGIFSTNQFRGLILKWAWLELSIPRLIPRVLISSLVLSLFSLVFQIIVLVVFRFDAILNAPYENLGSVSGTFFIAIFYITFFYIFWLVIYFLFHYIDNRNKSLQWEATITEFELNRLKSQLNPHFIFNALNSVRALVDEDPKRAKLAITQLSNILRNSLSMDRKKLIPFEEELKTVKDYLALETIRFEERLKVNFNIHPESTRFEVPPMMIQTIVENGIKHGISKLTQGGELLLETDIVDEKLVIRISNSGQVDEKKMTLAPGYGLANTRKRLELLYNNLASMRIANKDDKHVLTELSIPISYKL